MAKGMTWSPWDVEQTVLPHWVSITQAMALMGVTRRTVYNWLNKGKVAYVRTPGGRVRIVTETLWRRPSIH